MKKIVLIVVGALVLAAAAYAVEPQSASAYCKAHPELIGAGKTYKNFGTCVSKQNAQAEANAENAAKACKAEQNDPNFAAGHGGKSFDDFYGTSGSKGNGKGGDKGNGNAFGKCVSAKAKAATAAQQQAEANAAKKCKAERALDPAAFKAKYGTNASKTNAFGKCVAKLASAK